MSGQAIQLWIHAWNHQRLHVLLYGSSHLDYKQASSNDMFQPLHAGLRILTQPAWPNPVVITQMLQAIEESVTEYWLYHEQLNNNKINE